MISSFYAPNMANYIDLICIFEPTVNYWDKLHIAMLYFIAKFLWSVLEAVFVRGIYSFLIVMCHVALLTEQFQSHEMSWEESPALLFSKSI